MRDRGAELDESIAEGRVLDSSAVEQVQQVARVGAGGGCQSSMSAGMGNCLPVSIFETFGCPHPSPRRSANCAPVAPLERRSWPDVDLGGGILTVQRAFAKGRLKRYAKTERSRRRVPVRARTVNALARLDHRSGILFPNQAGERIDINNFRSRGWSPALKATGIAHRRIYDLRHTYATWSLAAGIDIFTLARRMGTSVAMIDRTYGHLAAGADDYERELLDAYDRRSSSNGRCVGAGSAAAGEESG